MAPQSDPVSGSPAVTPEAVERATAQFARDREIRPMRSLVEAMTRALAAAHPEPMVPASELEKAQAENERLRQALGAYRSALRSGEPESEQLRTLAEEAFHGS